MEPWSSGAQAKPLAPRRNESARAAGRAALRAHHASQPKQCATKCPVHDSCCVELHHRSSAQKTERKCDHLLRGGDESLAHWGEDQGARGIEKLSRFVKALKNDCSSLQAG
jgi:hypothetical protein